VSGEPAAIAPRTWPRFVLAHALQVAPLAVVLLGRPPWALWLGGIAGSAICCAATDSGWRWRNRLLVLEAIAWLLLPLVLGTSPAGDPPWPSPSR
jgi:hypothetical protein